MIDYHIGLDSTDSSTKGMCTTYLGASVPSALSRTGFVPITAPDLVRLNPNVPWKTRGNGSVAIRVRGPEGSAKDILDLVMVLVGEYSVLEDAQANPGIALIEGRVPEPLEELYDEALHRIVRIDDALTAAIEAGAKVVGFKNSMGLIGALSAIGAQNMKAWTWEIIAYRGLLDKGRERDVDAASIKEASSR